MTIQTFKSFIAEADAEDYVSPTDDDAEVKGLQPRSKGEQDFADAHVTTVLPHPVATDAQFVPKVAHSPHTGLEQEEDGERNFLKSYKDMFGNGSASQTTTRRGDNRTGDIAPVKQGSSVMHTTRESVDLDEAVKLSPAEASLLNTAMKTMSKENAKEFRQDALTSPANLKKALAFAKGVI